MRVAMLLILASACSSPEPAPPAVAPGGGAVKRGPPKVPDAAPPPIKVVACEYASRRGCSLCDEDGNVLVEVKWSPYMSTEGYDVIAVEDSRKRSPRGTVMTVAVNEQEIIMSYVRCPQCAALLGHKLKAAFKDIVKLPVEDRFALQEILGFAREPLLSDARDFRDAPFLGQQQAPWFPSCGEKR